ncbi:MAG: UDP-3-O-acyl-N-acetylglucosamine deacetylase [Thermodesulfobacteriota bacterium]
MFHQRTLKKNITCVGKGLHSGKKVTLTLHPADSNEGIAFVRTDIRKSIPVKVKPENVVETHLATTLGSNGIRISTVEHLLAALYGMGIDNLRIEVDSPELPIMDGSAAPFIYLIQSAGIESQKGLKKFLVIKRPVKVSDGNKMISIYPAKECKISYTIDFNHPLLREQSISLRFSDRTFERDIARARTFGFLKEVEKLRAAGLAKGGSLDNVVVLGEFNVLNEGGLRYKDEFVRHKILDLMGDISLLGAYIIGHIKVFRSGHCLNHQLVRKVLASPASRKAFVSPKAEKPNGASTGMPAFKIFSGLRA